MKTQEEVNKEAALTRKVGGPRTTVKYVGKAHMWVKTTYTTLLSGKVEEKQEWSIEEPVL